MARTTVPLMLETVKAPSPEVVGDKDIPKPYEIVSSIERGLEGKVILSVSFDIRGKKYLLTRYIRDMPPLQFENSARLEIVAGDGSIFSEDLRYRGTELCAGVVFEEVERREPEYLGTW